MFQLNAPRQLGQTAVLTPYEGMLGASATVAPAVETVEVDGTPLIEAFLDDIIDRLRSLPLEMQQEIRRELHSHLYSLIKANEELGLEDEAAILAAMDQFGDEATIANRFRKAWQSTEPIAAPWIAMRETVRVLGIAIAVYFGLSLLGTQVSPGSMAINGLCGALLWILPILAGGWIGRRTPVRAGFGAFLGSVGLSTVVAPILAYSVSRFAGDIGMNTPVYRLGEYAVQCLLFWPILCSLAASATSRIKWGGDIVKTPAALAVVSLASGMLVSVAEYVVRAFFICLPYHQSAIVTLLFSYLSMMVSLAAAGAVGWCIGKVWPVTERWTLRQVALLALGALMTVVGSNVSLLSFLANTLEHHTLHTNFGMGDIVLGSLREVIVRAIPTAGIAALVSSSIVRGGRFRLPKIVAAAATGWMALDLLLHLLQGPYVPQVKPPTTFVGTSLIYYIAAFFTFLLVKFRHRLPKWERLRRL